MDGSGPLEFERRLHSVDIWPTAGFADTENRCIRDFVLPIFGRDFKIEVVRLVRDRRVRVAKAMHDPDRYEKVHQLRAKVRFPPIEALAR